MLEPPRVMPEERLSVAEEDELREGVYPCVRPEPEERVLTEPFRTEVPAEPLRKLTPLPGRRSLPPDAVRLLPPPENVVLRCV